MSLVDDALMLSDRCADSKLLELRTEANRCRSFAACVILDETKSLLEARAAAYDRQVRALQAERSGRRRAAARQDAAEELA